VAGSQDATVQRWDLASGKATALVGHDSWVRSLAFHPNGETLFTAGFEGRLIWWPANAEAPAPLRSVEAHQGWVRAIDVSPDGNLLATAGNDRLVKVWNAADGNLVKQFAGHEHHVYNVRFHPQGQAIASADLHGVVKHWDLATGNQTRQLDAAALWKYDTGFGADIGGARGMTFRGDGKLLACTGITGVENAFAGVGYPLVVVIDWEKGEKLQQLVVQNKVKGVAWGARFHRDGFVIGASGGADGGRLLFWKLDQPNETFALKLPDNARDLDLHPDGLRLATPHEDGNVRIWQMTPKPAA
jgi:hypothetical protein